MATHVPVDADFACAYVLAQEGGQQHVQGQPGSMAMEQRLAAQGGPMSGATDLSVPLEPQADCCAGAWAYRSQQRLPASGIEGALKLVAAIGDNALEEAARGVMVPDPSTHGASQRRMRWFKAGFRRVASAPATPSMRMRCGAR